MLANFKIQTTLKLNYLKKSYKLAQEYLWEEQVTDSEMSSIFQLVS